MKRVVVLIFTFIFLFSLETFAQTEGISDKKIVTFEEAVKIALRNSVLLNQQKNVAALMPHPERALWDWAGGSWGRNFL